MRKSLSGFHIYILIGILASHITNFTYTAVLSFYNLSVRTPAYMYLGNLLYSVSLCLLPALIYFSSGKKESFRREYVGEIEIEKLIKCILFGICMWCAGQLINSISNVFLNKTGINQINQISGNKTPSSLIMGFLTVCVLGPVMEELFYRGVLWEQSGHIGVPAAIGICSFVFALAHGSVTVFMMPLIYGAASGYVMYKYKNILYPVIMHVICNLAAWLLSVCNISPRGDKVLAVFIIFVGFLTIIYVSAVLINKRRQVISSLKKMFLFFASDIIWIIIIADFVLRNIKFHT